MKDIITGDDYCINVNKYSIITTRYIPQNEDELPSRQTSSIEFCRLDSLGGILDEKKLRNQHTTIEIRGRGVLSKVADFKQESNVFIKSNQEKYKTKIVLESIEMAERKPTICDFYIISEIVKE